MRCNTKSEHVTTPSLSALQQLTRVNFPKFANYYKPLEYGIVVQSHVYDLHLPPATEPVIEKRKQKTLTVDV